MATKKNKSARSKSKSGQQRKSVPLKGRDRVAPAQPAHTRLESVDFARALESFQLENYENAWKFSGALLTDSDAQRETSSDLKLLAAYIAVRCGHNAAAHDLLDMSRLAGAEGASAHFVASLVALEFNKPQDALDCAKKPLALIAVNGECESAWLSTTRAMCETYLVAGRANYAINRIEAAIQAYRRVIEIDANCQSAYLELAIASRALGKLSEARQVVQDGIANCETNDELKMLAGTLPKHESISLCMMVKNEEEMLAQCLESVKGIVDEIIVVDTGSTDRTVEIAESYGAKVYDHPWESDFSKHRNQSLSYATCDWILILDADEELVREDCDRLRKAISQTSFDAVSLSVHNKHLRTQEITSFLPSIRLWRRRLNAQYEGIVHNELRLPPATKILRADIRVMHYGYGLDWEKMKKKIARSKELLLRQLGEDPNNSFANFNMAQLIRGEHKVPPPEACQEILKYAGCAAKNTSPTARGQRHIHLMALDQMTSAYFYLKDFDNAEKVARKALKYEPSYLDSMFLLGNIYAGNQEMDKAIDAYNRYIEAADNYDPGEETTSFIMLHTYSQPRALFNLGLIYEETGQHSEAYETFNRIFKYRETYQDLLTHLALVSLRMGDYAAAEKYSRQRLAENNDDLNARLLLARACHRQHNFAEARKLCRELLHVNNSDKIAMELLIAVERADNDDTTALRWIEELLDLEPDNFTGLREKADIFAARNEPDKALALYERLHRMQPRDAEIMNDLANCYFRLDEFKEAVRYYSEALALSPQLAPALRNLGLTYFKLGDSVKAIAKLANYLDYDQSDSDILYLIARLHFDSGNFADAIRYVERCLQLNPSSAELVALLADCYLKQGHVRSAQVGYQKALAIDPAYSPAEEMLKLIRDVDVATTTRAETEETSKS